MVVVAPAQSPAAGAPKVLLLSGQPTAAAGAPGWPGSARSWCRASKEPARRGQAGVRPRRASDSASHTHRPEEKALRRWARVAALGAEIEGGTGAWGRADRLQRSSAGCLAGPVPAWRGAGRGGAGQEVWTGRSIALGGVQGSAGLFLNFFRFCLVRDDQSRVRWHLGSRPSSCVTTDRPLGSAFF